MQKAEVAIKAGPRSKQFPTLSPFQEISSKTWGFVLSTSPQACSQFIMDAGQTLSVGEARRFDVRGPFRFQLLDVGLGKAESLYAED